MFGWILETPLAALRETVEFWGRQLEEQGYFAMNNAFIDFRYLRFGEYDWQENADRLRAVETHRRANS